MNHAFGLRYFDNGQRYTTKYFSGACQTMSATVLLDPARLDRPDTTVTQQPFPFLVAHGQLPDEARNELDRDFPRYASAGFFPYDASDCGPSINALIENMTSPEFAKAVGHGWASTISASIRPWSRYAACSTSATAPSIPTASPKLPLH
jgi:hypothetical protein